ncbi:MAG: PSD1 and planctomycete cytochrome C domain-containing protein [Synoicihabitans sp.]
MIPSKPSSFFGITCCFAVLCAAEDTISFRDHIQPILEANCVECHGPDKEKSDFRADSYDTLVKGGGSGIPGVVPGDPVESYILELITTDWEEDRMPPVDEGDPLPAEKVELLTRWIEQGAPGPELTVDFHTHIEPIFTANCIQCHGPDHQESGLRLDQRLSLIRGGDTGAPAIVPGDPDTGELLARIHSDDKEFRMPREGNPLPNDQRELIATWIAEGANWPGQMDAVAEELTTDLWSMQPVVRPEIPASANHRAIDHLLETKLAEHDIPLNPVASPEALIRRVSIILTGLPPKPERVSQFVKAWTKKSSKAYASLLDELFASPHFGERWAQHWLDTIRWAETTGYESNEFRKNAWPYRDYVVDALNADTSYDQFIREQLAGDSLEQDIAMGLLVAGPHAPGSTVGQAPADIAQAKFDRLDETIQSVSSSMMAVTMSCARCHNHKFDPISIADYYAMGAVFNDIEYDHRVPNLPDHDPRAQAEQEIMALIGEERAALGKETDWVETWADHIKVIFPTTHTTALRFHFKDANFVLDEIEVFADARSTENLALQSGVEVTSSKKEETASRPPAYLVDGRLDNFFGWRYKVGESESAPWIQMEWPEAREISRADLSVNRLAHYGWQYMINKKGEDVSAVVPKTLLAVEARDTVGNWHTIATPMEDERSAEHAARIARINALAERHDRETAPPMFIGKLKEPEIMHVMHRGSPTSPRGVVPPRGLEILDGNFGFDSETPGPERRLAFAEWLTDPEHPLTARVMVNRLWYHVFGTGIVTTPGDFGFAGATPTHPELLDWLASDFVAQNWSIKTMLRQMVSSDAFMRSSAPSAKWTAVDAGSQLLWRFPPRWLEAEVLRDSILFAAGSIDLQLGGLGYHIYQPKTRYDQWKVTDNHGEHTWRRMLYQQRMRRVDDQMFTAFDFPGCTQTVSKRPRSTTPLQALNLMNGNLIVEQSARLAARAEHEAGPGIDQQVSHMFALTLGRNPSREELAIATDLAASSGLNAVGRMLFNLNEFFYLN